MSWQSNLEYLIKLLVKKSLPIMVVEGIVKTVNEDSCDVEIEKDLTLFKVRLNTILKQESGIQIKPKQGSKVLCGIIENNPNDAFVIRASEVDSITINKGENGGLAITPKLVEELNKMTKRIDGIIQALNNAKPSTGAPDSGAVLIGAIQTSLQTIIDKENFSEIENEKIKH